MKLKYKMNCQIYYDDKTSSTYLVKRDSKYRIPGDYQDYRLMKNIICEASKEASLDTILQGRISERAKILQYTKLLLDKDVIYELKENKRSLQPDLMKYIISNFTNHEMVMEQIQSTKFALLNCPEGLIAFLNKMKLEAQVIPTLSEEVIKEYDVFFITNNYSEVSLKQLTMKGKSVVIIKSIQNSFSLLFLEQYHPDLLKRFEHFHISSNSLSPIAQLILPINVLFLYLEGTYTKRIDNMKYITGDGSLFTFDINQINSEALAYYDRDKVADSSEIEALCRFEEMCKTYPYLIHTINKTNTLMNHAPICNYQITFGDALEDYQYTAYHEEYLKAGIRAIEQGIEHALRKSNKEAHWVCSMHKKDYFIKGYIEELALGHEDRLSQVHIKSNSKVKELINFIKVNYAIKPQILFQSYYRESIGSIVVMNNLKNVISESRPTYQLEEAAIGMLYQMIGCLENQITLKTYTDDRLLNTDVIELKNYEENEILNELREHFKKEGIILKEEPWVYQSHFEKAGINIGKFQRVT